MKNTKKVLFGGIFSLLLCNIAQAQEASGVECVVQPTCEELGFTQTENDCIGDKMVRCQFDPNAVMCLQSVSCEDMGFTDNIEECPGEYDVCQYDKTKGKCIYEARPGDLKYSLRKIAHNGWLPCNGNIYSSAQFPELYEAIKDSFGNRLPNYAGSFLKSQYGYSGASLAKKQAAGLPNIRGTLGQLRGDSTTYYNSSGAFTTESSGYAWNGNSNVTGRKVTFDASKSSSIYGKSSTVTPQNYPANVFIYAGKRKEIQASPSTCVKGNYLYSDGSCSSSYNSSKTLLGMVMYTYNGNSNTLGTTGYIRYVYGGTEIITGWDNVKIKCSGISNVNDIDILNNDLSPVYDAEDLLSMNIASNSVVQKPVSGRQYWGLTYGDYTCNSTTCTTVDIDQTSGSGYYYCRKEMYLYNNL